MDRDNGPGGPTQDTVDIGVSSVGGATLVLRRDLGFPTVTGQEASMGPAGEEMVEVVDERGAVTDIVPRSLVRARNLRHRCTYVAVLDVAPDPGDVLSPDTEVYIHQRADWKDVFPSYWDLAFGGVCEVGEEWSVSARRELEEETGLSADRLLDLGSADYDGPDSVVVGRVFAALTTSPPEPTDGEVVAIDRIPVVELERWSAGRPVCPDSVAVVIPRLMGLLGRPIPPAD